MKNTSRFGILTLMLPLLGACAAMEPMPQGPSPEMVQLQDEVQKLRRDISDLSTPKPDAKLYEDVAKLGESVAAANNRLTEIEAGRQADVGRFEELNHKVDALRPPEGTITNEGELNAFKDQIRKLNEKVDALARKLEHGDKAPGKDPKGSAPAAIVPPPAPVVKQLTPNQVYEEAYGLYKQGKFLESQDKFKEYIKNYPDTQLVDNAYFWIGEAFYDQAQYQQAIIQYDVVVQNYPDGDKVSSALLKQAFSFSAMGDNVDAKILLRKVVSDFPDSEQAAIAKKKLEVLGN